MNERDELMTLVGKLSRLLDLKVREPELTAEAAEMSDMEVSLTREVLEEQFERVKKTLAATARVNAHADQMRAAIVDTESEIEELKRRL